MKKVYYVIRAREARWSAALYYDTGRAVDGLSDIRMKFLAGEGWGPDALRAVNRALKDRPSIDLLPLPEEMERAMPVEMALLDHMANKETGNRTPKEK